MSPPLWLEYVQAAWQMLCCLYYELHDFPACLQKRAFKVLRCRESRGSNHGSRDSTSLANRIARFETNLRFLKVKNRVRRAIGPLNWGFSIAKPSFLILGILIPCTGRTDPQSISRFFLTSVNPTQSGTGRIRFRRIRLQTPNSVNLFALTEFRGESSVSSS